MYTVVINFNLFEFIRGLVKGDIVLFFLGI